MRSFKDRLRHALAFEILGLMIITPLAMLLLHHPVAQLGIVTVGSALVAMLWVGIYNWLFDMAKQRLHGGTEKGWTARVVHAVLFEIGLLSVLLPLIAYVLQISIWQALLLDIGFALFYMVYAFVFNWGYDRLFPLPEWQKDQV
ncbi:PACE efflux transporter [Gemmobacter serpentinus]|uniref:PACE efflux transporter n=1 Tax=Gemmobacter serpentinus TaxID=2652247 RepID=UPI00124D5DD4|nr:PACE efflux transporter [Gemmobacter serpentinus]